MSDEPATLGDLADVEANMRENVKDRIARAESRIEERLNEVAALLKRAESIQQYEARLARVERLHQLVMGDPEVLRAVALWSLQRQEEP